MGKYICKICGTPASSEVDLKVCEVLCALNPGWRDKKHKDNVPLSPPAPFSKKDFMEKHGIKDADFRGYKNPYEDLMK